MYKKRFNITWLALFFLISLIPSFAIAAKDKKHPWAVSNQDYALARKALDSARKQRWSEVKKHAEKIEDSTARRIFLWLQYTSGSEKTSFEEIANFIKENKGWPDDSLLMRRAEEAMSLSTPPMEVIEWFTRDKSWRGKRTFIKPITSKGMQLLAEAQLKYKDDMDINIPVAYSLIRESWVEGNFGNKEQKHFLEKHSDILRQSDHAERIDRLLWDERVTEAQRIMKYADEGHRKLFAARIALIKSKAGLDHLISVIPASLKSDQGLMFDRLRWRAKRKMEDGVAEILYEVPANPKYPERWWKYKSRQIQEELQSKNYAKAYKLATKHGLTSGIEFAEAEWLAGWISLRFMNKPREAYRHFYNLYNNVVTPISLARGAYWSGRAAEANKNLDIAQSWYFAATKYPTTYYGQLANRKLGRKTLTLPPQPVTTLTDVNNYHANELVKAAYILHNLDRPGDAKKFLKAAATKAKTLGEIDLIAKLGLEVDRPDYGIETAREVSKTGLILTEAHYPVLPPVKNPKTKTAITEPEKALIHAIIMQESGFHHAAKSHMGAMGLMQLMPATARSMAKKVKVGFSKASLMAKKPDYNVSLGSKYLDMMVDDWDGSYILAVASYNAGPYNAKKWVNKNGDPRKLKKIDDIIDWVESIPFAETRNYVQRTMENLQIYRYVLGEYPQPTTNIIEDLQR